MLNDIDIAALVALLVVTPPALRLEVSPGLALLVVVAVGVWRRGSRR